MNHKKILFFLILLPVIFGKKNSRAQGPPIFTDVLTWSSYCWTIDNQILQTRKGQLRVKVHDIENITAVSAGQEFSMAFHTASANI